MGDQYSKEKYKLHQPNGQDIGEDHSPIISYSQHNENEYVTSHPLKLQTMNTCDPYKPHIKHSMDNYIQDQPFANTVWGTLHRSKMIHLQWKI
jgi:hypothetical protein